MTSRNKPVSYVRGRFPQCAPGAPAADAWQRLLHDDALRGRLDEPGRQLSAYFRERERSELGQVVATANALAQVCETVLIVAPPQALRQAQTLTAATTHPFHNMLAHGGRAGRPRVVLLEPTLDNDYLHGALDLVRRACDGPALHDRWALAIVGPADSNDPGEHTSVAQTAPPLVAALQAAAANDDDLRSRLLVQTLHAAEASTLISGDVPHTYLPMLPASLFFSGPAMLAATIVGADTVSLLKGAVWMWEAAKRKLAEESPVVQLAEYLGRADLRIAAWQQAVEPLCRTLAAAISQSVGGAGERSTIAVDAAYRSEGLARLRAHAAVPQLHVWCESVRHDRLPIGRPEAASAPLHLSDLLAAEYAQFSPTAEIRLARLNDIAVGELCQWFAAAKLLLDIQSGREA